MTQQKGGKLFANANGQTDKLSNQHQKEQKMLLMSIVSEMGASVYDVPRPLSPFCFKRLDRQFWEMNDSPFNPHAIISFTLLDGIDTVIMDKQYVGVVFAST